MPTFRQDNVMAASSGIGHEDAFYQQFQALLNESIPDCSPAEVQGTLTGLVCAGETDDQFRSWGALLVENEPENPAHQRTQDALCALMAMTHKDLGGKDFSFRPLLPPDTDPVAERTEAMAQWCHGFGTGFHWNGLVKPGQLEADAQDAIDDIAELAQVDTTSADSGDEDALIELEEYLKVAVQLIFEAVEASAATHTH